MGALDNMSDVFVRTFEQDGRDGWGGYDYLDLAAARAAAMSGANVLSGYGRHRQYEEEEDEGEEKMRTYLSFVEERMLQELSCARSLLCVDLETLLEEVAEHDGELLGVVDRW